MIDGWGISCEIALLWISLDFADDQSTLVQVMAWCHQATSHYLSQGWPRSLSPYGVTRPQSWVNWTCDNLLSMGGMRCWRSTLCATSGRRRTNQHAGTFTRSSECLWLEPARRVSPQHFPTVARHAFDALCLMGHWPQSFMKPKHNDIYCW